MPATSFCDTVQQVRTMTADSSSREILPNQQRPRRWFRFSLRTVLLAITIVGIVLGMFCARYQRAARQKEIVELLTATGATVTYDDGNVDPKNPFKHVRVPRGPEWLRQRLGSHFFDRIAGVSFYAHRVSYDPDKLATAVGRLRELPHLRDLSFAYLDNLNAEHFGLIGDLQQIESLHINKLDINDANAAQLCRSRGLRSVTLRDVSISDTGIGKFSGLPNLKKFDLSCSSRQTTDETVKLFSRFPRLGKLFLYSTSVTNEGIQTLSTLTKLKKLTVGSLLVTGEALQHVREMKELESIGAWGWKLEDSHVDTLSKMPSLKTVDLLCAFRDPDHCLTDQSIRVLGEMEQLTYLRVRGVGITDNSLPLLHNMTNLKKLILDDTSVDKTSEAATQLTQALPGCSIRYPETPEEIEIRKSFDDWKFGRRTNNPPANPSWKVITIDQLPISKKGQAPKAAPTQ